MKTGLNVSGFEINSFYYQPLKPPIYKLKKNFYLRNKFNHFFNRKHLQP